MRAEETDRKTREFAITVAEDWRGSGLAAALLTSLVCRARRDGHETMEGWVMAENTAMLGLARKLEFQIQPVPGTPACYASSERCSGSREATSRPATPG